VGDRRDTGLHKDNHKIDLEISFGENLQDEQHLHTAIIRDITERKQEEKKERALHASERDAQLDAEQANKRLTFLAEASHVLSSSLDYEATLRRTAELTIPAMADWCAVDVLTADGRIERLATAHKDPEKVRWALELQKRYPPDPNSPHGVNQVLSTGKPAFYQVITDALVEQVARDSQHLELLRSVDFSSAMIVPLVTREKTFGALMLVYAESGKHYREEDLQLAQELANRAAIAIDNARLYQQAQDLNETLESRVRQRTEQLESANRELETFSYSVSHDLRAPLRGIDGFSQALLEDYAQELDGTAKQYLERIRSGTQRMGN
jgi:GAF domain-containing protein